MSIIPTEQHFSGTAPIPARSESLKFAQHLDVTDLEDANVLDKRITFLKEMHFLSLRIILHMKCT